MSLICDSCCHRIEDCTCYYRDAFKTAALLGILALFALTVMR